jgi:hypothetical protein
LLHGETVQYVTTGVPTVEGTGKLEARRGILFVTDRRVAVYTDKRGARRLLEFAYEVVSSVDHRKGISFGRITLMTTSGELHVQQIDRTEVERVAQAIRANVALAYDHVTHLSVPRSSSEDV